MLRSLNLVPTCNQKFYQGRSRAWGMVPILSTNKKAQLTQREARDSLGI